MAAADTARLVASLTLDDKGFNKGINSAIGKSNELESTLSNVGRRAGQGLQSLGRNLAVGAAVGIGAIAVAVKGGLADLAELENAVTSVDGAISQLGLSGQLTGKQVADWANEIERDIDAAFDDKAITQAATTLLRFGKVTPKNLKPALTVVADLAAKTGDVESAANLLAKALADPAKAAGKLAKAGVILTQAQKDTLKAMVENNDAAGAQALILDAVAKSTGGAAKAMAGPYQDAINKTNDAIEDGRKALAVGFLPVITKVADKLSTLVADPKALASIKAFGETLAGGLDDLISLAERLPWESIGTSLQIAGAGAKAVLSAFTSLPPWVQTAVLTGWGLNKLTGGALGGIVSELAKGAIKGVLGITAGTVHINAATVVGGGGGVAAAGGGGVAGKVATVASLVLAPAAALVIGTQIAEAVGVISPPTAAEQEKLGPLALIISQQIDKTNVHLATANQKLSNEAMLANVANERLESIRAENVKAAAALPPIRSEMIGVRQAVDAAKAQESTNAATTAAKITTTNSEIALTRAAAATNASTVAAKIATESQSERTAIATASAAQATAVSKAEAASREAGRTAAAAIRDKDLSVAVNTTNIINNTISARETIKTQTTFKNYQRFQS